jgi:diadenosine tetraphosphate (Ap4A) HIT family hydrolase
MMDCDFCRRIRRPTSRSSQYDFHILWSDHGFVAVPALGALAPGHILLVRREHVVAMSELADNEWCDLKHVLSSWRRRLEDLWGKEVVAFEHGPSESNACGACIYHAHVQLLPLPGLKIDSGLTDGMTEIAELDDLRASYPRGGYVMLNAVERTWVTDDTGVPGQFLRRRICQLQGRPAEWDYLTTTGWAAMDETIDRLHLTL